MTDCNGLLCSLASGSDICVKRCDLVTQLAYLAVVDGDLFYHNLLQAYDGANQSAADALRDNSQQYGRDPTRCD